MNPLKNNIRIYEEKYKAETGKERPELTDDVIDRWEISLRGCCL